MAANVYETLRKMLDPEGIPETFEEAVERLKEKYLVECDTTMPTVVIVELQSNSKQAILDLHEHLLEDVWMRIF